MDTLRQVFFDNRTTTGTSLGSVFGVNQYNTPASFCRFARGVLYKSPPGYVSYSLVNGFVAVCLHPINVQIFKDHQPKTVDQLSAFLMGKIITPVFDTGMNVVKSLDSLTSLRTTLWKRTHFALDTLQVLFVLLHPALAFNRFTCAKCGKSGQAQVNTGHLRRYRQRPWFNFTRETSIPVTQSIALDSERFNSTFNGPVQLNFHVAYFGQSQVVISQLKARLLERETVISAKALVSWETVFMTFSDPAKKRLESQVNSLLNVLQYLRVNVSQFGITDLPARQLLVGIVQAQRFSLLLPGATTQIECTVIDLAARLKCFVQASALRFGWVDTVLECFTHSYICVNYSINVLQRQMAKAAREGSLFHPPTICRGLSQAVYL